MGYDAFGLPAENAAIKSGRHPAESVRANIAAIRSQMQRMGWSIDWSRELSTAEPEYYRWTQWIFLRLFEAGLAYRKNAPVKWCPNDQTVLANEQVIDGRCERCGHEVEARNLEQWFFKITDYAQRLLDDLAEVEWPERVVTMQRNWIGRSEGAEVVFTLAGDESVALPVFTTRPDTLFGATFFVLAPEHPLALELARGSEHETEVADYVRRTAALSEVERASEKEKTGRLHRPPRRQSGQRRADPGVGGRLRADGLRHGRGDGGAGARRARLRVRPDATACRCGRWWRRATARPKPARPTSPTRDDEVLVNSGEFTGMSAPEGKRAIIECAGGARAGPRPGRLPAARLAAVAPALLGLPDSGGALRRAAAWWRCPTTSCRWSCR